MSTYAEKLKDPRWQRRRLEILNRDDFTCRLCGSKDTELHVHHKAYRRSTEPWDYWDDELVSLCSKCHEQVEEIKKAVGDISCWSKEHMAAFQDLISLLMDHPEPVAMLLRAARIDHGWLQTTAATVAGVIENNQDSFAHRVGQ